MKKQRTMDDYILMGAWYRLLKDVSCKNAVLFGNNFSRLSGNKLGDINRKITKIETSEGFEDYMFSEFPELGDEGCCVFYGAVGIDRNELDHKVNLKILEILKEYEEKITKSKEDI